MTDDGRLRVLMVTDFYAPYVGGVEQHVRSLGHALVQRGHHVAVATLSTPSVGPRLDRDGPVTVHRVASLTARFAAGHASADRPWAPPVLDPLALVGLRRVVAIEQPDVIHGHDWLARSVWPLGLGRRPLVSTLHYFTQSCAKKTLWRDDGPCSGPSLARCVPCASAHYGSARGPAIALASRVGAAIERRTSRRTIAVSAATASGNDNPIDATHVVVPNLLAESVSSAAARETDTVAPVDLRPRRISGASELAVAGVGASTNGHHRPVGAASSPPGRPRPVATGPDGPPAPDVGTAIPAAIPDEPFLLYVGDLRAVKGVDVLLAAYRQLRDPPPLVLLGEHHGRPVDDLPAGVVAPGAVPNAVVREVWRRCLFGIVPSVWPEPFGIVVIEAMAAGRTVVASDVGGIPEIIDADRSGLLVPPGDVDALAGAVQRLIDDVALRTRLEHEARRCARRYRPGAVAASVEAVYRSAIADRRSRR